MRKGLFLVVLFLLGGSVSLADSLGDVSVSFCNTGSDSHSLNFAVQAGIPYEFCLEFSTESKEKIPLSLGFVDGQLTNDEFHNKACSHQGTSFSPYVTFPLDTLYLSFGNTFQKTGILLFPVGYSGSVHGCLVYTIPNNSSLVQQGGSLFDIVVRKAKFIDGYVFGDFVRDISFLSGAISYNKSSLDNSLVVSLPFINSGILPETIQFTGILHNVLGYERVVGSSQILSGRSLIEISFPDVPFYQGKYDFSFEASSVLATHLDTSYLQQNTKQPILFSYTKSIVLIPRLLILKILGGIFGLFLLRLFLKFVLKR